MWPTTVKEQPVSDRYDQGLKIRREVLGDKYVAAAIDGADEFNRDFQSFVTRYCWGESWVDDALSRPQRSLHVLCMTAALNRPQEFKLHFAGALTNGCTLAQLRATLLQIAVYCGIPAGVEAFRLAREVLRERGVDTTELEPVRAR